VKTVKTYIYTTLIAVFIAAFFSSFLTSTSQIVSSTVEAETDKEVLEIYYNCAGSIPFSTAGHENFRETNTFQIKTNDSKANFLLRIQSHTQLCLSKFDNSNLFFFESIARKKCNGYYLFNLCKLLI